MPHASRRFAACLLLAGLASPRPASAFYFTGWPGSGQTTPPPLYSARSTPAESSPAGQLGRIERPAEFHLTPVEVPEPAAAVLAGCGLLAAAVTRRRGPSRGRTAGTRPARGPAAPR